MYKKSKVRYTNIVTIADGGTVDHRATQIGCRSFALHYIGYSS